MTGAVACSVPIDENLCPIESLPVLKKLHFNKVAKFSIAKLYDHDLQS